MQIKVECEGYGVINIDEIKPIQKDLKNLTKENYEKLKNEIVENGFSAPFFVWNNCILDGTQRWNTLQKMKAEGFQVPELPYVKIEAKNEKQARRKLLSFTSQYGQMTGQGLYEFMADSEIEFDEMNSRYRFAEIKSDDFKLEFFGESPQEGLTNEDEIPTGRSTTIQLGDLFSLGSHRLLCGDSTSVEHVTRLMNGEMADMVFTDPPYNIAYEGKTKDKLTIQNDEMDNSGFKSFLSECYARMFESIKEGGPIYVCHADSERVNFTEQFKAAGFKLSSVIIWNKNNSTFGRQDYFWKHEPIIYGWKEGAAHKWYGPNNEISVWDIDRPMKSEEHPTMKPVALVERAMHNSSKASDLLFEPFNGSGSTMIACERNKRRCFAMELDPQYVQVAIDRWEKFTGLKAIKL